MKQIRKFFDIFNSSLFSNDLIKKPINLYFIKIEYIL